MAENIPLTNQNLSQNPAPDVSMPTEPEPESGAEIEAELEEELEELVIEDFTIDGICGVY
ncbi:MAG: mycofactocin precursor MftA [Ktedonobacteraceae bacterium]